VREYIFADTGTREKTQLELSLLKNFFFEKEGKESIKRIVRNVVEVLKNEKSC
jgi:hypothetical protein